MSWCVLIRLRVLYLFILFCLPLFISVSVCVLFDSKLSIFLIVTCLFVSSVCLSVSIWTSICLSVMFWSFLYLSVPFHLPHYLSVRCVPFCSVLFRCVWSVLASLLNLHGVNSSSPHCFAWVYICMCVCVCMCVYVCSCLHTLLALTTYIALNTWSACRCYTLLGSHYIVWSLWALTFFSSWWSVWMPRHPPTYLLT